MARGVHIKDHWSEQRLFDLMQKKFSKLDSGSIFYEFIGLTDKGPIVERR